MTPLTFLAQEPAPDAQRVPLSASIRFDVVGSTGSLDVAATTIFVAGVVAFAEGVFQPGFDNERSATLLLPAPQSAQRWILGPPAPFRSLQRVEVRLVTRASGSTAVLEASWSFLAADVTGPQLVGAQARDLQIVRVSFDEHVKQLDPHTPDDALNPAAYLFTRISAPAADVAVVGVLSVSSLAVDLCTDVPLTPGGRYRLEVRHVVDLAGNGISGPSDTLTVLGFEPPRPTERVFDLLRFLPEINRRDDESGDLRRFIACLQEVTDLLLFDVDRFPDVLDPDLAPEPILDLMLGELGNPFRFELSQIDKRRLVQVLVAIYREKGTSAGIVNAIRFFLALEVQLTTYAGESLLLGEARLGEDWVLGPSNAFAAFAFEIVAPRALVPDEPRRLRQIVDYMRPAHTHFVRLVEPVIPEAIDHLELGRSELGDSWMLHEPTMTLRSELR